MCWGPSDTAYGTPPADRVFTSLALGMRHGCGIAQRGAVCWGDNSFGQVTSPMTKAALAVAVGSVHSCALALDGEVTCWGAGSASVDAPAHRGQSMVPRLADGTPMHFFDIAAGDLHTCAVKDGGKVVCWGDDRHGQASPPAGLDDAILVRARGARSCAMRATGDVVCWGAVEAPPGPRVQPAGCTACAKAICGDGYADFGGGEDCDDGAQNSDSEPNRCRTTCRLPRCGDGVADHGEECDKGAQNSDYQADACR